MLLSPGPFSRRCSGLWWGFRKLAAFIIDTNVGQPRHFILLSKTNTHTPIIVGEMSVVKADRSSPFFKLPKNRFLSRAERNGRAPTKMLFTTDLVLVKDTAMIESIADFFRLAFHVIRSLFRSRESLERKIAEMRGQIAGLEASQTKIEHEDDDQS
jgi:hypothetical protein